MVRLGELMAIARECKGWSLRELEERSGVSNAVISQIETGKVTDPGFSKIVKLCAVLDVPVARAAKAIELSVGDVAAVRDALVAKWRQGASTACEPDIPYFEELAVLAIQTMQGRQ